MSFYRASRSTCVLCCSLFLLLIVILARPAYGEERSIKIKALPIYPELARRIRAEGTVNVLITVDRVGNVIDAKAINGNSLLWPAAENTARKYLFTVGENEMKTVVGITFKLSE